MGIFGGGEVSRSEFERLSRRVEELERTVTQLRMQQGSSYAPDGHVTPGDQPPDQVSGLPRHHLAEVMALLQQGRKIQAIKAYREVTGAGLREAKEAVERL